MHNLKADYHTLVSNAGPLTMELESPPRVSGMNVLDNSGYPSAPRLPQRSWRLLVGT